MVNGSTDSSHTRLKPNEYRVFTNVSLLNIDRRSIVHHFSNDNKPGFLHLSNFKILSIIYMYIICKLFQFKTLILTH